MAASSFVVNPRLPTSVVLMFFATFRGGHGSSQAK
jgi:hypothetical protein